MSPLTFLSVRLLDALEAAGEDGLLVDEAAELVPQLGWRLNELRSHGHVVGEDRDRLFLVHAVSTGGPGASTVAAAAEDAAHPDPPVDTAPRLFEEAA